MKQVTIKEQQAHVGKITKLLKEIDAYEKNGFANIESLSFSAEMVELIKRALACHMAVINLDVAKRLKAKECGAPEGQYDLSSHSEERIVKGCIQLMHSLTSEFQRWYEWQLGEDAVKELSDDEIFAYRFNNTEIVECLLLRGTAHSGGCSTRAKCRELGLDPWDEVTFGFEREEE